MPCIFAFSLFSAFATLANDDDKQQSKIDIIEGQPIIHLDENVQSVSGIQTTTLQPANYHAEFTANGKAVNIQPLVALRNQYLLRLAERRSATAKFNHAEQNIKRQQDLYRHGVTSKHNLQSQQSQWQADKSQLDAVHFQGQAIYNEAVLNWGKKLAEWVVSTESDKLNDFLSGRQTLLQITLPANKHLPDDIQTIYIEPSGFRSSANKASLISAAPQTDIPTQGESYFFQIMGTNIRTGMRIAAWIPERNEDRPGVIIPKSALIWYLDQAFVYIKTDREKFSRRNINHFSATDDGYFVSNELKPGDQLVTTGGQMLLSEEIRGQIPNEDD
ncbi:MAG: efflux RND transporter periplasmic adaptor subunit [Methylobacter sp.]